ncbi:hypothetical protein ACFQPC_10655 [Herminiimonas glaciei]|uniref:Uncharacterized protein n=1 Tax=Herminiimonas glaciei TaxID=523788 RepID=A0ABW2IC41_9BURK
MNEITIQVEIWKKIIDVQQHFNDLELRIRNFALIVTGAFIGLGGYAIKDGGFITILGTTISVAGLVVFCSILPWIAFYLMDRMWYHRLLNGAVKAAAPVELRLQELGIEISLGTEISKSSPVKVLGFTAHSRHKMDWFYGIIGIAIIILSATLAFGTKPVDQTQSKEKATTISGALPGTLTAPAVTCPPVVHNNIHLPVTYPTSSSTQEIQLRSNEISK